jgi:hypothetical protein
VLLLGNGDMLLLSSTGVLHADANGCGVSPESPDVAKGVVDMALHPNDAQRVFAVVSNPMGMSGVIQRGADGKWSELGVKDAPNPVGLRVAAHGDGLRFYEVVVKTATMTGDAGVAPPSYAIRVSDDEAKTWQEYPLMVDSGAPRLRAVDPSNSDRLLVVVERTTAPDTVLVSRDGGKTTSKYLEIEEPGGIAFAPDGKVWIGDLGNTSGGQGGTRGLYAAPNLDAMPTRLPMATYAVQCLAYAQDTNTLYACQRFWMGKVDQESGAFTFGLRFTTAPAFVSCEGEDTAAQCKAQLCLDYCGPAHFAAAPVCSAYDEPACGKPVAAAEADPSDVAAGSGGAPAAAGSAAAAAGSTAGSISSVTSAATAAGSGGASGPVKKGGCAAVPGVSGRAELGWFALGMLALAFAFRRLPRPGRR